MADLSITRSDPEGQLWDELADAPTGMLGIEGSGQHMQPMASRPARDEHALWFLARRDSEIVKAVGGGASAQFCIVGKRHDYHACLCGALRKASRRENPGRASSPALHGPYAAGKEDPDLTLLELRLQSAAVWASASDALPLGWQIAGADDCGGDPNLAVRARIRFHP